jgi:hypothetical protein
MCFLLVLPEGWHTPAYCTKSSTAGQPMWVTDKGASRTHPVYPHPSTIANHYTRNAKTRKAIVSFKLCAWPSEKHTKYIVWNSIILHSRNPFAPKFTRDRTFTYSYNINTYIPPFLNALGGG